MLRSYLSPSPSSDKLRSKRRRGITSTSSLQQNPSSNSKPPTMGIVDYEDQHRPSSGLDGSAAAAEPPPGCDRDSLWWALVTVASERYDEMVREEEAAKAAELQQQQQLQQQVEEPLSLVVQDRDQQEVVEDGDGDDRLVIDEAGSSTAAAAPAPAAATTPKSDSKRKPAPEDSTSSGGNYQVAVRYNANMARKFPGAENRTPEQQAVRARNTVAARQSRAKMRIMEEMLTHEASDERTINDYMKERIAACFMYGNNLREILQMDEADFWAEFQAVKDEYIAEPLRSLHVVPRTISDGSCSDYQDYSDDEEGEEGEEEEEEGEDQQQPGTSADTVGNRRG